MFHWDRGIFLTTPRLALDVPRRQPHGFVSHAHADHIAPHQVAYCTAATAELYRHRLGVDRRTISLDYRRPRPYGAVSLTVYPAGHCLGSAMLLIDSEHGRLLYTGDYKLDASLTAEPAELPRADVLIMESTFGRPRYRLPPRATVVEQLVELAQGLIAEGITPVVHAYALGKAQEATRILTDAGIGVMQHPDIYAISEVYRRCGVELGDVLPYATGQVEHRAVVTLPKFSRRFRLPGLVRTQSIALTGWAAHPSTRHRWKVDHALPLSDHADFEQLLATVEMVGARQIYCTHGPGEFVDQLRSRGHDARPVVGSYQTRMF